MDKKKELHLHSFYCSLESLLLLILYSIRQFNSKINLYYLFYHFFNFIIGDKYYFLQMSSQLYNYLHIG